MTLHVEADGYAPAGDVRVAFDTTDPIVVRLAQLLPPSKATATHAGAHLDRDDEANVDEQTDGEPDRRRLLTSGWHVRCSPRRALWNVPPLKYRSLLIQGGGAFPHL